MWREAFDSACIWRRLQAIYYAGGVRIAKPVRAIVALLIVSSVVAMLLVPGATTAVLVQTGGGKQVVRVISLGVLALLALAIYRGVFDLASVHASPFRQVSVHGFGPDLLDKTCARLC
jgi:hypothetical protein